MKKAQPVERQINAMLTKIDLFRSMAQRITSSLEGERVSHTRNVSANEDAIIRLSEAHDLIKQLNLEYQTIVNEITEVVSNLEDPLHQKILLDHYLGHQDLEAIADKSQMSRAQIYRHHKAALDELEELLV